MVEVPEGVNLYHDSVLVEDVIEVPLGYLYPGEPYVQSYVLRNDGERDAEKITFNLHHPEGLASLSEVPSTLKVGEEAVVEVTWLVRDNMKILKGEGLGSASLSLQWDVVVS